VREGVQTYVKCLVRETVGKRLLRRNKRRWEYNTKTVLKETERKELIWFLIRNNSMVREKYWLRKEMLASLEVLFLHVGI
jgi:hypothetical protein